MKIGELLVSKSLISWAQLEEALDAKKYFGGRLGENLVEMGFVSELELARCLSEQLELPYVKPEEVAAIPPSIIEKVPRALAEKHRLIPLRMKGPSELDIGMADPSRIDGIDLLGFELGLRLRPHIITEVTLNYALERYYGVPRPVRRLSVPGQELAAQRHLRPVSKLPPGSQLVEGVGGSTVRKIAPLAEADEAEAVRQLHAMDERQPMAAPAVRPLGAPAAAPKPLAAPTILPAASLPPVVAAERPTPLSRLEALAGARSEEDIVVGLTQYLAELFDRVLIAAFAGSSVSAVTAAGVSVTPQELASITVPLQQWSILHEASISPRIIHEDNLSDPALLEVCKAAHLMPAFITVIPIHELRRASHVAICQGRDLEFVREHLVELKSFVHKVSCALQILTLRSEILTGE